MGGAAAYSSSVTWSPHVALLPLSSPAMCVLKAVGAAPCQWSSPGSKNTRSPGRMTSIGPPRCRARPTPSVTKMVWPLGCVCHAVLAPGVKCTMLALKRDAPDGTAAVSMYTAPVNQSLGPFTVLLLFFVTCMSLLPRISSLQPLSQTMTRIHPAFRGRRCVDAEERARLIKRYREGHRVVMGAFEGIRPDELDKSESGEWTPRQIAHHLADSEMMSAIRIRRLLAEDEPVIHGYDEGVFARKLTSDRPR